MNPPHTKTQTLESCLEKFLPQILPLARPVDLEAEFRPQSTVVVTTASGERNFSKSKLIKNQFVRLHVTGQSVWVLPAISWKGHGVQTGL